MWKLHAFWDTLILSSTDVEPTTPRRKLKLHTVKINYARKHRNKRWLKLWREYLMNKFDRHATNKIKAATLRCSLRWQITGLLAFQELLITEEAVPLVWFSSAYVFLFINLKIYSSIQEKGCNDNSEERESPRSIAHFFRIYFSH